MTFHNDKAKRPDLYSSGQGIGQAMALEIEGSNWMHQRQERFRTLVIQEVSEYI